MAAFELADSIAMLIFDGEPMRKCAVIVRRLGAAEPVVTYEHNYQAEAESHVADLRRRADEMSVAEFEHDLGI